MNKKKIYVVDDDWRIRQSELQDAFEGLMEYDIEFYEFNDPYETNAKSWSAQLEDCMWQIANRNDIALVLMDVFFPAGGGSEPLGRASALRIHAMGIPVLSYSGSEANNKNWEFSGRYDIRFVDYAFKLGEGIPGSVFLRREAQKLLDDATKDPVFYEDNQEQDEKYANDYDVEEATSIATVSFLEFEKRTVIGTLKRWVENSEKGNSPKASVLDIGCGTGRFEEVLLRSELSDYVGHIRAIDYSARMLEKARERTENFGTDLSERVSFERRLAERLPQAEEMPDQEGGFDLLIMGFGVPSFVKGEAAFHEAFRVMKPGAYAIFSPYNTESWHYTYESVHGAGSTGFTAVIKEENGQKLMGPEPYWIQFNPYSNSEFATILKFVGFEIIENHPMGCSSFPTLACCMSSSKSDTFTISNETSSKIDYSAMDPAGVGLNAKGLEDDLRFSQVFPDRGYYHCIVCRKPLL